MQKRKLESKILIVALIIAFIGLVIFGALSAYDYSLVLGWASGTFAVLTSFALTVFLSGFLLKKERAKSTRRVLVFVKSIAYIVIHAIFFILVVVIDKHFSGVSFSDRNINVMYSPINVFTYIGGIGIIVVATLVAHTLHKKGE